MAALLLVLLFSGCAATSNGGWQEDRELVMKSLEDAHLKVAKLEAHVEQLDQKVLELQKNVMQQQTQIEALTAGQLARRTTSTEAHSNSAHQPSGSKHPSSDELSRKLDRIANNIDKPIAGEKGTTADPNEERDTYTAAYLAYKGNKFDESIATFRALLAKFPAGQFSDQAYFWLGEGLLAKHRTKEAAKAFNTVVMDYPKSGKHAMALLRLAATYNELNRKGDARATLQRLLHEHPDSPAAQQASQLLAQPMEKSK